MNRVIAYIDGFNLYFGMKSANLKRLFWLDLSALARALLKPEQQLEAVNYFTARIRDNGRNIDDQKRQNTYIEALQIQGVRCQFGHFLDKPRACRGCKATWTDYEEKMTDVNIAVQLLSDAMDERFDTAIIISGDSDLVTPIRWVRQRYPGKRLIVAFPPMRHSADLKRAANGFLAIGEDKLRASQLSDSITKPGGHVLQRPGTWK